MPWREFTSKLRESEVRAGIQRETGGQADAPSFLKKLPRGKEGPQRGEGTRGTLRWEKGPEGELELTVEPTRFTPTYEELIQKPRRSLSEELQEIVGREHATVIAQVRTRSWWATPSVATARAGWKTVCAGSIVPRPLVAAAP